MSDTHQIKVRIVNIYEDGDEITTEATASVTVPEGEDMTEWAYDELFPLTGTGRTEGNSAYFLTITEFPARPDLVGQEFEFGV